MSHREHRFITMGDGVRLASTLYVPDGDGPWPALLEALPYRKDDITATYRPEYLRLADAGYVVCRVDVRGTGSSEGIAIDEYPAIERTDMLAVIDWLATQDWSTGNVGMYGTSYSGFNSIQIAMERPPALKAIIPIFATDDRYADDVHYFGGALKQLDLLDYPSYMVAMNALPPVPSVYGEGWREEWERRVRETEPWLVTWLEPPALRRLLAVRLAASDLRRHHVPGHDHRGLGRRLPQQLVPDVRGAHLPEAADLRTVGARLHRYIPAGAQPRPDPRAPAVVGPLAEGHRQRRRPRATDRPVRAALDACPRPIAARCAASGGGSPRGRRGASCPRPSSWRMRR